MRTPHRNSALPPRHPIPSSGLSIWIVLALELVLIALSAGCSPLEITNDPGDSKADASTPAGVKQESQTGADGSTQSSGSAQSQSGIASQSDVKRPGTCIRGGRCSEIHAPAATKADFLFVIDNSGSMRQEQASLRAQFPKLVRTLTTGEKSNGDTFPPIRDLHLGVVSTDMGLVGLQTTLPGCGDQRHFDGGDDGVLLHQSGADGCNSDYPAFLSFEADQDDPEQTADAFGCVTDLGTMGCGIEQPLEAALKAVWPKYYTDASGKRYAPDENPVTFNSTTEAGRYGHGDTLPERGGNGGFARNDPTAGLSILTIVVVTDEEDCSSKVLDHLRPDPPPDDPLAGQGINLRCYYNKQNLFNADRYWKAFQKLRPGHADTVMFAAIVGVPPDLVDAAALANVDFDDPQSVDAYYQAILDDSRMQERPTAEKIPAIANLAPSCSRTDSAGERADAYPPRRIVEVAQHMGKYSRVQSICQDDFGPVMDNVIDLITANRRNAACLPKKLARKDGKIKCDVIVELPPGGVYDVTVPTSCDASYLQAVEAPRKKQNLDGGVNCKYAQLAVSKGELAPGDGFYYDDFDDGQCTGGSASFIAFTDGARPTVDLNMYLDCEAQAEL